MSKDSSKTVIQLNRCQFSNSSCNVSLPKWQTRDHRKQLLRNISVSCIDYKKRKSPDERAAEKKRRHTFKYSNKGEVVGIWNNMTVKEIADVLGKDVDHVLKSLVFADKTSGTNYVSNTVLYNLNIIREVLKISGFRSKIIPRPGKEVEEEQNKDAVPAPPAPPEALRPRPPVVCVMGHVDHGKTTLLDALRDTSVVEQEFGGITQHIGAFEVELPSGAKVTFLDTPGHAAFTAMRARGAHATDIVVLVVAADDGVMEQTVESIRMAKEAKVPILVAINKIDKPGVNIEKTMRLLAQHDVICEAVGGDVQAIPVSALKRTNLNTLVEALTLQAQMMELKADPGGSVEGVIIESQIDHKAGRQATVLVQRGTLRRGCIVVAGLAHAKDGNELTVHLVLGEFRRLWTPYTPEEYPDALPSLDMKVRVLKTADGRTVEEAKPSQPVSVLGWKELPSPGDQLLQVESEKRANEVMKWRHDKRMKEKQKADQEVIEAKEALHNKEYKAQLAQRRALGYFKLRRKTPREKMIIYDDHPTLNVVVKGDVDGSVEAILDILETYNEHETVKLDLVHFGVGQVTPNDIEIAEAFKAVIYAFNVECTPPIAVAAKDKQIEIKKHNVIYKLIDDIKDEINTRIPVKKEEEVIGEANVLQQFLVTENKRKVPVAGSRCTKGSLIRNALYKLIRDGEVIYTGKLASMKHLKEEVATIKNDTECGLRLDDPTVEVKPGDTIVCYKLVDVRSKTGWDPGF